jgi:serpin B
MKRFRMVLSGILGAFLLVFLIELTGLARPAVPSETQIMADGNTALGLDLYRVLGAKGGNLFFSPYSISAALGMTYAGAREHTAAEMAKTLHFGIPQGQLPSAFMNLNRLLAASASQTGQKLNIANALVLTGGNVSPDYKDILRRFYEAEVFPGGLDEINGWVKKRTEGKIEKILEELSGNSVCVILNAIYFKGLWGSPFDKSRTHDAPFLVPQGKPVTVPFMSQEIRLKLLDKQDFQVVTLPYMGDRLSMVILLPKANDGLPGLEKNLTTAILKGWLTELDARSPRKLVLVIPKFKLETKYDLVEPFASLGMPEAFQVGKADFSGMGWPKGDLWIEQIKHRAFVDVTEEGTEAAAATAVEMATKSMEFTPVFRADHPFFFLIRDNASGVILFLGRMIDPGAK